MGVGQHFADLLLLASKVLGVTFPRLSLLNKSRKLVKRLVFFKVMKVDADADANGDTDADADGDCATDATHIVRSSSTHSPV